jgi:TatD DNase family protein
VTPALVDIGVNLTHKSFREEREAVIERARGAGVVQMIVTGTRLEDSFRAYDLARRHPAVLFSTAGVHPHNARECTPRTLADLHDLALRPGVVAIGECGLDYDRNFSPPDVQRRWFAAQVALALELGRPLFLHERAAHDDFQAIIEEHQSGQLRGVVHCFTGGAAVLEAYLALGLHIGITGWICDERRGRHLADLVQRIPADRLLVETDAPFLTPRDLTPPPPRGRNEPSLLPHVARRIAAARGVSLEELARETTASATALFGLTRAPY